MLDAEGSTTNKRGGSNWQPVLLQSFEDELELPAKTYRFPAEPGSILIQTDNVVDEATHEEYRMGVGKLSHLSKYSRPGILNVVRELSRFCSGPNEAHVKCMKRCVKYCVDAKDEWRILQPNQEWDGSKDFEFEVVGYSDPDYAKHPETRRSVSGLSAFLNGAPYTRKSKMQKFVILVTEAECVAATDCVQDLLFEKRFLEEMELKVKLPMPPAGVLQVTPEPYR
jgi:hypothetical protein